MSAIPDQIRNAAHVTEIPSGSDLTDAGNAARLVGRCGNQIRYLNESGKWLICDEETSIWRVDTNGVVVRMAIETLREALIEAAKSKDRQNFKERVNHFIKSHNKPRLDAMIALARSGEGITIQASDLDRDPYLLGVKNGVVDLRTGLLRHALPNELITKTANVVFDPDANCPNFDRFLADSMSDSDEMIGFVRRLIGYSLFGGNPEQVVVLLLGPGANGKSTLLTTIQGVLGAYAITTPTDTLMARRDGSPSNDIARLHNARFVSAAEAGRDRRLNEALIKRLSGSDPIPARFLFAEYFEFSPQFILFLAANHRPIVSGDDPAIWRRLIVVPFKRVVPVEQRDRSLLDKLVLEGAGILAWAVQGFREWETQGLSVPEACRIAAADYREEMDHLGSWMAERCVLQEGLSGKAKDLHDDYVRWADLNGHAAITSAKFGTSLVEQGIDKYRTSAGNVYRGIGLLSQDAAFGSASYTGHVEQ